MPVLLLRLEGPMQSWGDSSRFSRRITRHEPTKSGVVGLVASAMGRSREDAIDDLAQLEMGVRIDQPGSLIRDFQVERSLDGKKVMPLTHRYYLADAKFLVALGGDAKLLDEISVALRRPKWPLYLGRRACSPANPIMGEPVETDDLREVLTEYQWIASDHYKKWHKGCELELVCDARDGEPSVAQPDYPLSFSGAGRSYAERLVWRHKIKNPDMHDVDLDHDPMSFF